MLYIAEPYLESRLHSLEIMRFFQRMADPNIPSALNEEERDVMATFAEDFKILLGEFDHTVGNLIRQNRELRDIVQNQSNTIDRLNVRTVELVKEVSKIEELEQSLDKLTNVILRNLKNIDTVGADELFNSPIRPGVHVRFAEGTGIVVGVAPEDGLVKVLLDSHAQAGSMQYDERHLILPIDRVAIIPT